MDNQKTSNYDYDLPESFIASYPAKPADSAKLLVYEKSSQKITHTTFKHILDFIPKDTKIFLNDTKVIKARIFGKKETGGKIELLLNKPMPNNKFLVFIRGKVLVDNIISFSQNVKAKIIKLNDEDGSRIVEFYQNNILLDFDLLVKILNTIGNIPLPPYINRETNEEDDSTYQTLFAQNYGAVAAPTASLHFTDELFDKMKSNYDINYLTLHVGAGTFKSVEVDDILEHQIHSEFFDIPKKSKETLDEKNKILAIGTTVTRTIEFYDKTKKQNGEANIFLNPFNKPKKVDYLITNFHLPKSTLIMLIASFIGTQKTLELYEIAKKNDYKFFSYGDAMLII